MIIRNALVFTPELEFVKKDIVIENGVFTENENTACEVIDGEGCYAIPGLLDLHFHGAVTCDVGDATPEAYASIAEYEASQGITAICPATLTLPVEELEHILSVGAEFAGTPHEGADLVGFNMEGPFISYTKRGAQNPNYLMKCDPGIVDRFISASKGLLKIIGLAPEENPGFEDYIKAVTDKKVVVSLAHTNSDYETAMKAFRAGASHAVHLFNAMPELTHRAPGVVGAVADCPWVNAEIIADGIHNHPAAVRAAFRMMGRDRMVLISDSLRCAGAPDGEYDLGGQTVVKKGKYCTLKEEGNLAGSVSNLMDCLRTAVLEMGIPLTDAVAAATINPARAIGVDHLYGSIENGKKGNVVLLKAGPALELAGVIKDGKVITGGAPAACRSH